MGALSEYRAKFAQAKQAHTRRRKRRKGFDNLGSKGTVIADSATAVSCIPFKLFVCVVLWVLMRSTLRRKPGNRLGVVGDV